MRARIVYIRAKGLINTDTAHLTRFTTDGRTRGFAFKIGQWWRGWLVVT